MSDGRAVLREDDLYGAATAQTRRTRRRRRLSAVLSPLLILMIVFVGWEAWIRLGDVPIYVMAPPIDVLRAAVNDFRSFWPDTVVTAQELGLGFIASVVGGIAIALVADIFEPFKRAIYPFLIASQVVPLIATAPILILWFGFGLLPKVLIVFVFGVFVIVINSAIGLQSLEVEKEHLARSMGAGRLAFFLKIKFPQALPHIFSGLKLAATHAVIGAVLAEYIAASEGLGYRIIAAESNLNTVELMTGMVYLVLIGVIIFFAAVFVERLVIPWHVSRRVENVATL